MGSCWHQDLLPVFILCAKKAKAAAKGYRIAGLHLCVWQRTKMATPKLLEMQLRRHPNPVARIDPSHILLDTVAYVETILNTVLNDFKLPSACIQR